MTDYYAEHLAYLAAEQAARDQRLRWRLEELTEHDDPEDADE